MNKLCSILGIFIFLISMPLSALAANPCKPIAKACMKAGYYKGGNTVGKGLVENCMLPIVNHNKTLPNQTFSDSALQQCKMELVEKMKSQ